ncbi:phospholipid carrier-dependent glycosyltransferase [Candidatus Falkowbacteria bacterium]|nr:phospholipid carrier-dependent glycosyltransferase [Candidatus Falkowbacteria bacterium]
MQRNFSAQGGCAYGAKIILACLAVGFFLVYSFLTLVVYLPNAQTGMIFDWPDEMANYFFIKNFAQTSSFTAAEPLNALISNPYIHPRSVNIVDNAIVPMSFLGMLIVYGALAKIISVYGALFLTPLFAVLTVVFLSLIMKRLFGEAVGIFSAILCFIVPGFWYYASQPMLPNVLFIFCVVSGLYLLVKLFGWDGHYEKSQLPIANDQSISNVPMTKQEWLLAMGAGLCLGFAAITRAIEVFWVALVLLILLCAYWQDVKKKWPRLVVFCVAGLLPILLMLFLNHQIYGKIFTVGYLRQDQPTFLGGLPTEFKVDNNGILNWLKLVVAPFGLHVKEFFWVVWQYIIKINWPFFILAIAAIGRLLAIKKTKIEKIFLGLALAPLGLALFYGNWIFVDKMVLKYNYLSSSYVRYFLLIYIFCALLTAWLVGRLRQTKLDKVARAIIVAAVFVSLFFYSCYNVFFNTSDGLLAQQQKIIKYHEQRALVENKIPANAILLVDRADKIFWPEHKVVIFQGDFSIFPEMKKLLNIAPIYYYGEGVESLMDKINEKLKAVGVSFQSGAQIVDDFHLYKLTTRP